MANLLKDDGISYEDAWIDEEYKEAVVEEALRDLGFIIEPQFLFRKMVKMVETVLLTLSFLQKAINALVESTLGNDSQEDLTGCSLICNSTLLNWGIPSAEVLSWQNHCSRTKSTLSRRQRLMFLAMHTSI